MLSLQADDPGSLLHVFGGNDRPHRHPQPGASLGGLHQRRSSGVNRVLRARVSGSLPSEHKFGKSLCSLCSDVCVSLKQQHTHSQSWTLASGYLQSSVSRETTKFHDVFRELL